MSRMSWGAVAAAVAAVLVVTCGGPAETSPHSSPSPTGFSIQGSFQGTAGKRLAIDCGGSGDVTVVLEVGFDAAGTVGELRMQSIRDRISSRYRVCNYDRVNLGQSDHALKPRTTGDIADDLAALLRNASVPGPYLLVGASAGGLYAQHFAARHPRDVLAVLALNPEVRADLITAKAFPLMTAEERAAKLAYLRGANSQGIDYEASARQMRRGAPLKVPLSIMQSYDDCRPGDATCKKLLKVGAQISRQLVAQAPKGGRFIQVRASHHIDRDVPDRVVAEIDRLAALTR